MNYKQTGWRIGLSGLFLMSVFVRATENVDVNTLEITRGTYTADFGVQSLKAPLLVSETSPLVTRRVTLPQVTCGGHCNVPDGTYVFDEQWTADSNNLDTLRTSAISGIGTGQKAWVFSGRNVGSYMGSNGILLMVKQWDGSNSIRSVTTPLRCITSINNNHEPTCIFEHQQGTTAPAVPLEIGLLIVSNQIQPGDILAMNRPLLKRQVTFYRQEGTTLTPVAVYADLFKVRGTTQMASCSVNSGDLNVYLPARDASKIPTGIGSQPPTDRVEKNITFTCSGINKLTLAFTPLSGTLENDRLLKALPLGGDNALEGLGFQFWHQSNRRQLDGWKLVVWNSQPVNLLADNDTSLNEMAENVAINVGLRVAYTRVGDEVLSTGPVIGRGMYTATYE